MSDKLISLAERCERASGPDSGLWGLIVLETGLCKDADPTASLDAAMTLVPENCLAMVKQLWDKGTAAKAALANVARYGKAMWTGDFTGLADTPALALTAAALRSRAAQDRQTEDGNG